MSNITILTEEQVFGDKKLNIFNVISPKAAVSDTAILRGAFVSDIHVDGDDSLAGRTCYYWLKNSDGDGDARVVGSNGGRDNDCCDTRDSCVRAALPYSSIQSISPNCVRGADGLDRIEYGFYSDNAVDVTLQRKLQDLYNVGSLKNLGKGCTFDSRKYDEYDKDFLAEEQTYYEYNGKKYTRIRANSFYDGNNFKLSNGEEYKDNDYVWTEIKPVIWLKHPDDDIMITEKGMVAGIRFYKERGNYDGDFTKTDLNWFIENHLAKDLEFEKAVASIATPSTSSTVQKKSRIEKMNPDTSDPERRRDLTYTELIKNWVDSGQSVLLRGPSGIGKTERIKSLYPNLIYLKLTNQMFPEKVVGSVNLQTGQSIPPDYAKQAILACATDEEKKQVSENIQAIYDIADEIYERSKNTEEKQPILLDELLNVKPAVQSLVYTLVLNRLVETGKGLKLPDNVVIIATGNQKKYSNVAEDLAEPLEKRIDHILDMMPKVGEWLNEYAIPNKVHPSVIGYILSKYISKGKSEQISDMGYFYEEPEVGQQHLDEYGCNGRTNDPRGWVSVSNSLYSFEKNLKAGKYLGKNAENILQMSINTKLRSAWATDFYNFYNLPTLSPEDVLAKNYTQADLPRDTNERFAFLTSLLLADEKQVGACREFIRKYCDPEYLSVYDIYWAGNDEKRMEKIMELDEITTYSDDTPINAKTSEARI